MRRREFVRPPANQDADIDRRLAGQRNRCGGTTQQFTATATYSDGSTANVTSTASWTSANTAVATINPAGLATAIAAGSTTGDRFLSGITGTATLTVHRRDEDPDIAVAVSPRSASVAAGATQQFTAMAHL